MTRKSGFDGSGQLKNSLALVSNGLGQCYPQQKPGLDVELLGQPLSIREVAGLIGCSVWTIRQRYLRAGLPYLRMRPNGKLIFYRNQVVNWLLTEQQKGGIP